MALKARWNLVLRLLVDNGLREKEQANTVCLGMLVLILRCIR